AMATSPPRRGSRSMEGATTPTSVCGANRLSAMTPAAIAKRSVGGLLAEEEDVGVVDSAKAVSRGDIWFPFDSQCRRSVYVTRSLCDNIIHSIKIMRITHEHP